MFVYLVKFEKQPNLIKIGKSIKPDERLAQLYRTHGKVIYKKFYDLGSNYSLIERLIHREFQDKRKCIAGEGGTEFFCESITDAAEKYLATHNPKEIPSYELEMENIRYHNLIGTLLGYKNSTLHTGGNSMYTGWEDIIKLTHALELGFSEDEVFEKYITANTRPWLTKNRTTKGRIKMAYQLSLNGSSKYNRLKASKETLKTHAELPVLST